MFAVVKTGGKQYRVAAGDQLRVEKLAGDAGDIVELNEVLMVGETIGTPLVDGACVAAEIVEQGRARKVIAFKKRRRQNSRRTIGHRQHFSLIEVTEILTDGKKPSKKAGAAAAKAAAKADKAAQKSDAKADAKSDAAADGKSAAGSDAKADAKSKGKAEAKSKDKAAKADVKSDDKAASAKSSDKAEAKSADAAAATAGTASPLFTAPAGDAEDLTKIKGIGPVAKGQLAEQGITQFAQVAALTDADIAIIDEAMPFSADQISDWRAQAKDMVKG